MEGPMLQKTTVMLIVGLVMAGIAAGYIFVFNGNGSGIGACGSTEQGCPMAQGYVNSNAGAANGRSNSDVGTGTAIAEPAKENTETPAAEQPKLQEISIRALSNGAYDKQEVTVKKGIPVKLSFSADTNAGCGRVMVVYGMGNVRLYSQNGETQTVTFTPQKEGTYEYNCGMRMWRPGKLIVKG